MIRFDLRSHDFYMHVTDLGYEERCKMNDANDDTWIVLDKELKNSELFHEGFHIHRCEKCKDIYSHNHFNVKGKLCTMRSDRGICPNCS
jgi:hypothetical protein